MASAVPSISLGDPQNGGALFTLPREIRDEIYRFAIQQRYTVFIPSSPADGGGFKEVGSPFDKPDPSLFLISRATSREIQDLLYAESTFRYSVDFRATRTLKPPPQLVHRMQKVKILIGGFMPDSGTYVYQEDHPTYKSRIAALCEATIDDFTGARILRDTCHIHFPAFRPDVMDLVSKYILPKLATFIGFRTIEMEVFLEEGLEKFAKVEAERNIVSSRFITAEFEQVRWAMKDALEPGLGPAVTSNEDFTIHLEFQPLRYVPSMLRDRAREMTRDAERLEGGRSRMGGGSGVKE